MAKWICIVRETDREGDVPFAEVVLGPFTNPLEANDAGENYVIFLGQLWDLETPSLDYEYESYPVEGVAEAMIQEAQDVDIPVPSLQQLHARLDVEKFYDWVKEKMAEKKKLEADFERVRAQMPPGTEPKTMPLRPGEVNIRQAMKDQANLYMKGMQ